MSTFRDRLEEEVNRIGVSHISSRLSIARNTVYNWVAKGNVPLNMLMALEGLDMDTVYVLTGQRRASTDPLHSNSAAAQHSPPLNPREEALLDNYRHAGEEGRRILEAAATEAAKRKVSGG